MMLFLFKRKRLLTRLILINTVGLLAFFVGILYYGQTRYSLTDAYLRRLNIQAQIMAQVLGDYDMITGDNRVSTVLNRENAMRVLRRMMSVSQKTRVWLYDKDGKLLINSDQLQDESSIISVVLPSKNERNFSSKLWHFVSLSWYREQPPILKESYMYDGFAFEEVRAASKGDVSSQIWQDQQGKDILTVAIPIQRYRAIIGVLLLVSPPGEIDQWVDEERLAMFRLFMVVLGITIGLSIALAGAITLPIRKLADAIQKFKKPQYHFLELNHIPDLSDRQDEIGDLSLVLRDILQKLLTHMDEMEHFSADIAHELKNPLASMSSAIQTLVLEKNNENKKMLIQILHDDVYRMNRLITDIAEESRLNAEMKHINAEKFDLSVLIKQQISMMNIKNGLQLEIQTDNPLIVHGQKERIIQIFSNLVENALSFSPEKGVVVVQLKQDYSTVIMHVLDEGKGLHDGANEKIFERFYMDRVEKQNQHSGLGLSISRHIAHLHGGDLVAMNRKKQQGACFTLSLPLCEEEA